jgi:hypothetical protein
MRSLTASFVRQEASRRPIQVQMQPDIEDRVPRS